MFSYVHLLERGIVQKLLDRQAMKDFNFSLFARCFPKAKQQQEESQTTAVKAVSMGATQLPLLLWFGGILGCCLVCLSEYVLGSDLSWKWQRNIVSCNSICFLPRAA